MPHACQCGRPFPPHIPSSDDLAPFSQRDRQALTDALCHAFAQSAPVLSQALSDALQAQFERVVGHGVVAWLKRLLLAGLLTLAGYALKGSARRGPAGAIHPASPPQA